LGINIYVPASKLDDTGVEMLAGTFDMGDMMDWGGWGWPFMGFWMIGLWVVLAVVGILVYFDAEKRGMNGLLWLVLILIPMFGFVALIIYLVIREGGRTAGMGGKGAGALLDERYAKSEISREEYLRMKEDLGGGKAQT
jgi:putative membrane protein